VTPRRPTQVDEFDEHIEPDEKPEHDNPNSLAAEKRTRERFHEDMPRIKFDDESPIFRSTVLYDSILERGMLSATSKLYWLPQESKDDIAQATWLYLLEKPMRLPWIATAKELFVLAYYPALRQYNRQFRDDPNAKAELISQMNTPNVDCGDGIEPLPPWDRVDLTAHATDPKFDDLSYAPRPSMVAISAAVPTLSQKDRQFMVRYSQNLRSHTNAQTKRYQRLKARLPERRDQLDGRKLPPLGIQS
jgi:hypothetical protein